MAKQTIDIGNEGNDGTGDAIRESFRKVNENFTELYAVFGIGGQIGITDLTDTPNSYVNQENKVLAVNNAASATVFLELASDNALNGSIDTIGFDFSVEGKLIVRQLASRVVNDPEPTLGGPLNGSTQPIANIAVSQAAIDTFNSIYGTNFDVGSLVIDKNFADRSYQAKEIPGGGIRIADEPNSTTQYTLTATGISLGNLTIPSHGLSTAYNGAPFVFRSTGTDPFGVTTGGTYFVRVVNSNSIALYNTSNNAINNTGRILLSGGSGSFTITDGAFDDTLEGNWLDNVALPRKSIVRRQGDTMEGRLNLSDHPGELSGFGLPNGPDDLQAATKLYVDNASAFSLVNLYVSTNGTDDASRIPSGKHGRSPAYAFKTVNAACQKAEEIIESSQYEPGPYMQTMTYNNGSANSAIVTAGITSPIAGRNNARILILANKEFIAKEVTGYIDATYPNFSYNREICQRDIGYILDSVSLDALLGNNANYLSRWAGIRYFANPSAQIAIGVQKVETLAGINYARDLVINYILTNTAVPTTYQNRVSQTINLAVVPDGQADDAIDAKFTTIVNVINNGVLNAPNIIDGSTTYKINTSNGSFGFIDQANPENTDIIPGKVVRGRSSGAIGRIIDYKYEAGPRAVSVAETDEIEVQLLEPVEFQPGEELEFGNIVRETQITVFVESGIYLEDLPIRVPANVSIKGDEFRRSIVRPKNRISQSRYASTFFYRDREFDNLVIGKSNIEEIGNFTGEGNDPLRAHHLDSTAEVYTITDTEYTTTGSGSDAVFTVSVFGDGSVGVVVTNGGKNFKVGDSISIDDADIGGDGGPTVTFTVTKVPNGVEYVNPLTGQVDGYFGYHYLKNPAGLLNVGAGYSNIGGWETGALILVDNKEFIQEQVIEFMEATYPAIIGTYNVAKSIRDVGLIVDALIADLRNGGNEFSLEAQGAFYEGSLGNVNQAACIAGMEYIYTMVTDLFEGNAPATIYGVGNTYSEDLFNGSADPDDWANANFYRVGNVIRFFIGGIYRYYQCKLEHTSGPVFNAGEINAYWLEIDGPVQVVENLIDTVVFAFDPTYNPPLHNKDMDVFLMNDATIIRNLTVQGHGGFMCVLDPQGQILTKSPYIQTGSSFTQSVNRQAFRGGLFVDAFTGNSAVQVISKVDGSPFRLNIQSLGSQLEPQGLFVRRPQTPCPFYIDGRRFQVNAVTNYDPDFGTAQIILDPSSNDGDGFTGVTSILDSGVNLDDLSSPISVTLQTAGNRSMLGNDFTQVNDLGYGLVCVNGALSEMVSMFTYYCWTSYYAKNGSEIRSLTGSSCYGEFGLVAEGSDPNEVPDSIILIQDMVQPARTFAADVVLYLTGPIVLAQGDIVTQIGTAATGTVAVDTSQADSSGSGSTTIYLIDVTGAFNTTNQLQVTGPITGDSTITNLGPNSVPLDVDSTGYSNEEERLSIHVYDMKDPPSNRSELDVYHPARPAFARYEVANVEVSNPHVGSYREVNDVIPAVTVSVSGTASGAVFTLYKTISQGYTASVEVPGTDYSVGDTITVNGIYLGGTTGGVGVGNNAIIQVTEINSSNGVLEVSVTGDIFIEASTPVYSGKVYKLNFSTSNTQFSNEGLLEQVNWGVTVNYRRNQTHILGDIARPDILTIRPSTAVIFKENPTFVYRSISFLTSNSIGEELPTTQSQAGFDTTYDYIRLIVDSSKASETPLAGAGITKGATAGDRVIAVIPSIDANELSRLNNNAKTPEANRPLGWTAENLVEAPIFSWGGKKHYVYNYRGVNSSNVVVPVAEDNEYGIVDIEDVGEDINYPSTGAGLASSVILGSEVVTIRAGLQAGAIGDVTVNISTCRATSHDFLDVGTGGFNQSNYPNVIFGLPREADQSKEVVERTKGRVFYVSTDQDGVFRVGRFFSVDQGTGTVTFSANIALSDVDGLGFKRGVVITEFSTDSAMTDNATDSVPTESAVRGYVNRRLGYDVNGNPVVNILGPGVLAPNGAVPMTGDLNAAGNTITNLSAPNSDSDAATKAYVDQSRGDNDTVNELRDTEINNVTTSQLFVTTGYKKIIIDAGSVVNGPFQVGNNFTGSLSAATGNIVDWRTSVGFEGNIIEIIYTPNSGTISSGPPTGQDVIVVSGGAQGLVIDGPMDEWANGVADPASDITVQATRIVTGGVTPSARYTMLNLQYTPNSIVNADVNASAAIAQSKLSLNAATTRANATGITQNDLGVASFDSANFDSTNGWISLKDNGIGLGDLAQIATQTVLGNSTGSTANVAAVSFATVIQDGGGLQDSDFTTIIASGSDPGEALIKTGVGTYGISNVTKTGEVNSIVKTDANGSIQVNSLILGGNSSYEILALDTTTVVFKTPAQGEILRAVGGTPAPSPTYPTIEIPGNVNIGGTGVSQSVLQAASSLANESRLAVDWIYSSFIEAPGEKTAASTGIAIGANTGKTTAGQIGIVTRDTVTSSSLVPFIFSSTGVRPDVTNVYNIGSSSFKYNTMYATLFSGTALEAYYADLAENYLGDAYYEPGTVLVFGGENEVSVTNLKGDHRVAGVVSTEPATLMNSQLAGEFVIPLALQGRVPCKVIGRVQKGDILVTSPIPGYACVDNNALPGRILGKALQEKTDTEKGVIEVVVGKH